jgi:hypothetical protein
MGKVRETVEHYASIITERESQIKQSNARI